MRKKNHVVAPPSFHQPSNWVLSSIAMDVAQFYLHCLGPSEQRKEMFSYGLRQVKYDEIKDIAKQQVNSKLETCEIGHFFQALLTTSHRMQSDGNFNLNLPGFRGRKEQKEILWQSRPSGILCHFQFWFLSSSLRNDTRVLLMCPFHFTRSETIDDVLGVAHFQYISTLHILAMEFNLLSSTSFEFLPRIFFFEIIDTNNFKLTPGDWWRCLPPFILSIIVIMNWSILNHYEFMCKLLSPRFISDKTEYRWIITKKNAPRFRRTQVVTILHSLFASNINEGGVFESQFARN